MNVALQQIESISGHRLDADQAEMVRAQMRLILASRYFRNSKRYPGLLKFLVEAAIEGKTNLLKERLIGMEVFGRLADYDSNSDPIVRLTIAEIRKRIALYYHETDHEGELRIELTPGSYVPSFYLADKAPDSGPSGAEGAPRLESAPGQVVPPQTHDPNLSATLADAPTVSGSILAHRHLGLVVVLSAAVFALGTVGWIGFREYARQPERSVERFWEPLVSQKKELLICVGSPSYNVPFSLDENMPIAKEGPKEHLVVPSDVANAFDIANKVQNLAPHVRIRFAVSVDVTLSDLRNGPSVLIGANNNWSKRIIELMRYQMVFDGVKSGSIVDRQNPQRRWTVSFEQPIGGLSQDYGIIARITDPATGNPTLVLAGILGGGTTEAKDLVTNSTFLTNLLQTLPPAWESKNLEIVVGTKVVGGKPGIPEVLATHVW